MIGLGSNLGDRKANLDGAIAALRDMPGVNLKEVSSYHETPAVGGPARQGAFLNAVATAEPTLEPHALLGVLQEVESRFGRSRTVRWGERTLDLDLLLYGEEVIATAELSLPHPRFALRRFALAPAAEVAPQMVEPWTERTLGDLLANLDRRPSLVALRHSAPQLIPRSDQDCEATDIVFRLLVERLGALGLSWTEMAPQWWLPAHRWNAHLAKVRSVARRMTSRRWPSRRLRDRWLVADFYLHEERMRVSSAVIREALQNRGYYTVPFNLAGYEQAADRAIQEALQPTFTAVIGPRRLALSCRESPTPVLIPDADQPDEVVTEILATCAATRS
jgi:2-amino-4-hydroxy-6-hydroxymethyldihydropteridine diphosphokinase